MGLMSKISPTDLNDRLSDDEVFLLDIRPAEDYHAGHIEGSYNAPAYDEVRRGNPEALDTHLSRLPSDKQIVTICKAGVVAKKAASYLEQQGYKATTLTGGFTGWEHYEKNTLLYRTVSFLRGLLP